MLGTRGQLTPDKNLCCRKEAARYASCVSLVASIIQNVKRNPLLLVINAKNFHGSLTIVVRAQNDTPKTANITCTIFDRTLV